MCAQNEFHVVQSAMAKAGARHKAKDTAGGLAMRRRDITAVDSSPVILAECGVLRGFAGFCGREMGRRRHPRAAD